MNLILTILIVGIVVLLAAGIIALAWGIAHAPEGHEDESGFHIDWPCDRTVRNQNRPLARNQGKAHPAIAVTLSEPVWY